MANRSADRVGLNSRFLIYVAGKTISYAVLGGVLGVLGSALVSVRLGSAILAVSAGLIMILLGLQLAGVSGLGWLKGPAASGPFVSRMADAVRSDSLRSRFLMGVMNGLLPCGLVYAALTMSLSTGSVVSAASFMAVFGVGTIPALWVAAQLMATVSIGTRVRLTKASGWLVVLFGAYTVFRGIQAWMMPAGHSMMH